MPTFGEWERAVLTHTYDDIDYISCHAYYEEHNGDLASFLASAVDMDHFIETVIATADHVGAIKTAPRIDISFDEWNVWYIDRYHGVDKIQGIDNWPVAPRLLEDIYTVADAVVFGNLLISLLKHADRVTSACFAQLVNVIAPIMTEPGGGAWKQTTFFPFATTSRLAVGSSLEVRLQSTSYETAVHGTVPLVDAVATHEAETGAVAIFLVNRDQSEAHDVTIDLSTPTGLTLKESVSIWDDDFGAQNTAKQPDRVVPRTNDSVVLEGSTLTLTLPPVSWTALSLGP